jgi:hypothetical protein
MKTITVLKRAAKAIESLSDRLRGDLMNAIGKLSRHEFRFDGKRNACSVCGKSIRNNCHI